MDCTNDRIPARLHEVVKTKMVRPERIELPTSWFVAKHSIQLSYGRIVADSVVEL